MKSLAQAFLRCAAYLFGVASLVAGLAVLSSIPVLNFLAFGYLLEAAGRTARSGRWRDGIFGHREAALLGAVALAGWMLVLPIRFISSLWRDADLLGAAAPSIRITGALLLLLTGGLLVVVVLGLLGVGYVHGRDLPGQSRFLSRGRDGLLALLVDLRLPRLFTLGLCGWIGGFAWLVLPIGVFYAASRIPSNAAVLVMGIGLILLVPVATSLPLVQARFAASRRFRDLFDWPGQRRSFQQAPLASLVAVLATFLAALPLYLLKIELTPRDLAWLPGLFFILLLWPAKILAGWAIYRAEQNPLPRPGIWTWSARLLLITAGLAYGLLIWTMQYLSWSGARSFLEQHAFLLPAPLL